MTTQFVRRTDQPDAAGRSNIQLLLYADGLRLRTSTLEKCKASEWDSNKQQFRRSFAGAQEANEYLRRLNQQVAQWWRELRATGETPTTAGLRAIIRPAPVMAATPVVAVAQPIAVRYEEYREAMRARGYAWETLRQHIVARNLLTSFEQHRKATLDPVTYDLETHDKWLLYLRTVRNLAPNSIYTAVKDLKSFLRFLRDERGVPVSIELRKLVAKPSDSPKLYLSAVDLEALAMVMLPASLVPVRDVFLFCCYTGLRYSDVAALHPGNLHEWNGGRVLRLVQSKTRAGVSIFLTAAASAIIDKYAGERTRLLPVTANQVMNRYLKRIAKLAGLTRAVDLVSTEGGGLVRSAVPQCELVTVHTARHTFATQSLLRGMPVEVLQKILGHKKIQTTLIYAKIIEDFQHHTMQRIWDAPAAGQDPGAAAPVLSGTICAVEPLAA